ncbi:MAG: hypothetical protein LQ342_005613 [Letrouitia transgressa]|nr:MAG: hypothetical protein LQ342_005613 [Letrouitia transgressa]
MALTKFLSELKQSLSAEARVMTDASQKDFQLALLRWSDVDVKVPAAIVLVMNEDDAVQTVKTASKHQIPFVPVCGGHSLWSTIGSDGFILDLTSYKSVQVNAAEHQATITGGTLMKELATALASEGECAGGGIGVAAGLMGFACDNMLSAKIILADGRLVLADGEHYPDLFWAIKGAGFYFGVVVEITLRTYPLSIFGTIDGRHWIGRYVYPIERASKVLEVVKALATTSKSRTAGLVMIIAPPPHFKPMIAVGPHYFGSLNEGPEMFKDLENLGPVHFGETTPYVPNLSDHLDFACGKGGLRRFNLTGLREFKVENALKVIDLFQELLDKCPDAASSGYFIEWHCPPPHDVVTNSAFSHEDVHIWL